MNEEFGLLPMSQHLIVVDEDILDGAPVFAGTRVPAKTLSEYVARGLPLAEFLEDFPAVSIEQAQAVLSTLPLRRYRRTSHW